MGILNHSNNGGSRPKAQHREITYYAACLLVAISCCLSCGGANSKKRISGTQEVHADTIVKSDVGEEATIKRFITDMYNNRLFENYTFLEKHCSQRLLKKLADDYDYDSEGVAYAVWDFRTGCQDFKEGSAKASKIISVKKTADGWYQYEFLDVGWYGINRLKCHIEDGEVIMDALENVYDECMEE